MIKLEEYVRSIPDFPQEGIIFRDVTSVLEDADGMHLAIDTMQDLVKDLEFDVVVGAESRGFIFGAPIAYNLHKPFALIRKKGKLPCETVSQEYSLEYGTAVIEMHKTSIKPGQKVLIVDDLIATGGTTQAMISLVERLGGEVAGVLVLIELAGLKGFSKKSYNVTLFWQKLIKLDDGKVCGRWIERKTDQKSRKPGWCWMTDELRAFRNL